MAQGIFSGIPIRDFAEYKGKGKIYLEGTFSLDVLKQMISRVEEQEAPVREVRHA